MPSSHPPVDVLGGADEHYVAHPLVVDGNKAHAFEIGMDDSYVADADVSSHPSSPSSGGGGETTDIAASPLLQPTTTTMITTDEEEAEHEATPYVSAPPQLTSRHHYPTRLRCSAPPGSQEQQQQQQGALLSAPLALQPVRQETHALVAPRRSPSLQRATPPSAPVLVPRTPPPELRYPHSAKVGGAAAPAPPQTPPPQQTPRPREVVAPMVALEVPPPRSSPRTPPPLSLPGMLDAVPSSPLTTSRVSTPPAAPSPRAPYVHEEEPDVCCICLEEYDSSNPMFRGECRHHFHLPCLMEWKQRSNACPMCCAETLHGVGDLPTPHSTKPVDPAVAAQQREIARRDEVFAHELQRKYLLRAQQQQPQSRHHGTTTRVASNTHVSPAPRGSPALLASPAPRASPTTTPGLSPQMRPQRNITPLPPLASPPPATRPQPAARPARTHSGRTATAAAAPPPPPPPPAASRAAPAAAATAAARTASSQKKKKADKGSSRATPPSSRASEGGSRPRSTSPAVHPQFRSEQRLRRRSGQNGCSVM